MNTMRVIEPKNHRSSFTKKRSRKPLLIGVVLVILATTVGYAVLQPDQKNAKNDESKQNNITQSIQSPAKKGILKQFTGEQFRDLYNSFAHPNTARISERTPITGNEAADQRIRTLAVERGYKIQSAPVSNAFQDVGGSFILQKRAAVSWLELKEASQKEGIQLGLTAALRSADEQKAIFLERLAQTGIPVEGIATGAYDKQITQVLRTTAIPGYSRHHSGYTVDIACKNQPAVAFENTVCFNWLSANNYKQAKTYGWIPSYPEGAGNQGPDPEAWEYVWVGKDAVTE